MHGARHLSLPTMAIRCEEHDMNLQRMSIQCMCVRHIHSFNLHTKIVWLVLINVCVCFYRPTVHIELLFF